MHPGPTIASFLDDLAAATATPGAGAAAALTGAMGAALVSMVARLTLERPGHEANAAALNALLQASESLRQRLAAMAAEDAAAFGSLLAAWKLPKGDAAQQAARSTAIQAGLLAATHSPLACARAAAEGVRLAARVVELGHRNVVGDVGTGVLASFAALRGAALNVRLNAPQIRDPAFATAALSEIDALLAECGPLTEWVHDRVRERAA